MSDDNFEDQRIYDAKCPNANCNIKCPKEDIEEFGMCFPCFFNLPQNDELYATDQSSE